MQGGHCAPSIDGGSFEAADLKKGTGSLAGAKMIFARAFARRCGACIALAALMLQLALSFAHVHKHDLGFSKN